MWIAMVMNIYSALKNWDQYKRDKKYSRLSREMDIEFKLLSEAFANQNWDKFLAHQQRWQELHEAWNRDYNK